ncbi:hypothetical protein D1007_40801 [Hordeum vulgare]|nr:hypothetical protein D1007_40801 [Hordeum vulgare]
MSEDENVEDTAESPMKPVQMEQDEETPQPESSAKKKLDMSNATTAGTKDQSDHQSTTSMGEAHELPEHTPPPPQVYVAPRDRKKYKAADVRHHRNMAPTRACAVCGAEDSWIHSLLTCTMARCVWVLHNPELVEHMLATAEPDAKSWLFSMRSSMSETEMTKITVTLWAIWYARHKLIHEGEHQSPGATLAFVNRYLTDLELNKPSSRSAPTPVHSNTRRWIKPPAGWTKINVDGAVCKAPPIRAISAVCRDEQGAYLGSSAVGFHGLTDPLILETLACRGAQALGRDLLLQKITVASDCLNAIQDINSRSEGVTGPIIKEILDGNSDFQHILFTHEGRLSNMEAHHLARYALHFGKGCHVWLLEPFDTNIIPVIRISDQ